MQKQQRIARGFLFLACLLIVTCLVQRVAPPRALFLPPAPQTATTQLTPGSHYQQQASASTSSCDLSHKSLSGALPLMAEAAISILLALFTLLALPLLLMTRLPPPPQTFPPRCRLHLEFCNLRE